MPMKCPGCGGQLEISLDMDQFICAYCGTDLTVEIRGGAIFLKQEADAIGNTQGGTDRTAWRWFEGILLIFFLVPSLVRKDWKWTLLSLGIGCGFLENAIEPNKAAAKALKIAAVFLMCLGFYILFKEP